MDEAKKQADDVVKEEVKTESLPEVEKPKPTYKMYERDFSITDCDLFDYYKTRMKMLVMNFMLVGRFDEEGNYRIKDDIKYDLAKMYKEIEDSGEDFYRASCRFMDKDFYFDVKIEQIDDGKAKASLTLSEFVDNFLESPYIVSHIADFVDVYDEQFRVKVRQAFNLYDVAMRNDEARISALTVLLQDEYDINVYIGGLYDLASQIYLMRMLKLLESGGEVGQKIIARYKALALESGDDENEKHKFTRQKALLDRAIDEFGGLEKLPVDSKELKSIVVEINKSVKAIDGLQNQTSVAELIGKEDKAPLEKTAGKKSASKSKGKSGGSKGGGGKGGKGGDKKGGKGGDKKGKKDKDKDKKTGKGVSFEKFKPEKTNSDNTELAKKILAEDDEQFDKKQPQQPRKASVQSVQRRAADDVFILLDVSTDANANMNEREQKIAGRNRRKVQEMLNSQPQVRENQIGAPSKVVEKEQNQGGASSKVVEERETVVVTFDENNEVVEVEHQNIQVTQEFQDEDEREL